MRALVLCLFMLNMIACHQEKMKILSSKKQLIIPAIKTVHSYVNYCFEIEKKNTVNVVIDSVHISKKNEHCYKINTTFQKKGNADETYILDIPFTEDNYAIVKNCIPSKDQVTIYYKEGVFSKHLDITSFVSETIRK